MAERIPADMDAFLREHAARATPLPEVRAAALARWPHSPDADDDQRRAHAARIETAYKHRRKHARDAARAALAETSVPQEVLFGPAVNLATDQGGRVSASVDSVKIEDLGSSDVKFANAAWDALFPKEYPEGWPARSTSLATPLVVVVGDEGVSVALATDDGGNVVSTTADVNAALAERGVVHGTKVKIVGPNGQEWVGVSETLASQEDTPPVVAPVDPLSEWTNGADPAPFLRRIDAATRCSTDESVPRLQRMTEAVEMLGVTVDNVRRAVEASPNRPVGHLSLFEVAALAIGAIESNRQRVLNEPRPERTVSCADEHTGVEPPYAERIVRLQEMIDALKSAQQTITVRSDVECLEGVVDNMAAQVGRLTDAVSQMLAQAQDAAAAKDALIETQRRFIEHLQRTVGA